MRGATLESLRRRARRRPVRWAAVAAVAVVAGLCTSAIVGDADRERVRWGPSTPVAVATRDLAAGAVIGVGDVIVAPRPRVMLPDDATTDAVGRVVTAHIAPGEVVLERRLSGGTGPLALLEAGAVAFAVPVDPAS
ncbi:MAG: hypothetical protein FGM58_11325, partial [Acidimicrobiia bacterium]|nr:hypothetical protein [Acidimicrobiia bacterium]